MYLLILLLFGPSVIPIGSNAQETSPNNKFITLFWDLIQQEPSSSAIHSDLTPKCVYSLKYIKDNLLRHNVPTYPFIDSSGKIPDGILDGTLTSLGDYDQCLSIRMTQDGHRDDNSEMLLTGKYCVLKFMPAAKEGRHANSSLLQQVRRNSHVFEDFKISIGTCLPDSCQESDIKNIYSHYQRNHDLILFDPKARIFCDSNDSLLLRLQKLTTPQILALLYCILVIATVSLFTLVDLMNIYNGQIPDPNNNDLSQNGQQIFSMRRNFMKLFEASAREGDIDYMRLYFVTMTTVVHSWSGITEFRAIQKTGIRSEFVKMN